MRKRLADLFSNSLQITRISLLWSPQTHRAVTVPTRNKMNLVMENDLTG
jgi:hypothetical protein